MHEYAELVSTWKYPDKLPPAIIEVLIESYRLLPAYINYKFRGGFSGKRALLARLTEKCAKEIELVFKNHGLFIPSAIEQYIDERPQRIQTRLDAMNLPDSPVYFEFVRALSPAAEQFALTGRMRDHVQQLALIERAEHKFIASDSRVNWLQMLENEPVNSLLNLIRSQGIEAWQLRDIMYELSCRHAIAATGQSPLALVPPI